VTRSNTAPSEVSTVGHSYPRSRTTFAAGASDNVAHSTGEITNVTEAEDGTPRFTIKNANTGKETDYQQMNIVGKAAEE